MENTDGSEEPESKKRHLSSSAMARTSPASPDHTPVDAAVLQYQNQKLVQQLDAQKQELHVLEDELKELKEKQCSYDDTLIAVNKLWNQLDDDLILLGVQAGGSENALQALDGADGSGDSVMSCTPEGVLLYRLLQYDSLDRKDGSGNHVEEALSARQSSTLNLVKSLGDTLDGRIDKAKNLASSLDGKLSEEDAIIQQHKIEEWMGQETTTLQKAINILELKHKAYEDEIQTFIHRHSVDQSEIKRVAAELEESMAELEESRRKIVNLKMQMNGLYGMHLPALNPVNGSMSPEKPLDRTMGFRELKTSLEEAKTLAATRLSELQEAQVDTLVLSKKLQEYQDELKDEKFVFSSRPYTLLSDQAQHWNAEVERYKELTDSLQADRTHALRREMDLNSKSESADIARNSSRDSEARIEELEHQLQRCIIERNDLGAKMEEAEQDSGRKDINTEFRVMGSAFTKEMGMMEAQLGRCKEVACEALSLREEAVSLKEQLNRKMEEHDKLVDRCAQQMEEIKSCKALVEKSQKETQELQIFLEMYGQERFDNRDLMEIKESERRAHMQAEVLKNALDEHSLELRVKAANEAEAACQHRLSAAELEITDLRAKLDTSEREVLELREAIKVKDSEAEAYISEIETIGQAYEDMQTQNQHLVHQVSDRDDFNIKIVSESVKTKQMQTYLLSEKQTIENHLLHVKASQESFKLKIASTDDQLKANLIEVNKASIENRRVSLNVESAKWELSDAEKEMKWLRSAVGSSDREFEHIQQNVSQLEIELENERADKRRLEEELAEVNSDILEMTSESGDSAIQRLQDEVKECKAILKCGVCFDRPKEVVITKCFHLFCNPCIQRNLEIRHRKCPGCGTAFGQSDVRFVKI
ncbi:RING-type E3 ubiquitin transferase [Ranunculus cassubicifolius]